MNKRSSEKHFKNPSDRSVADLTPFGDVLKSDEITTKKLKKQSVYFFQQKLPCITLNRHILVALHGE